MRKTGRREDGKCSGESGERFLEEQEERLVFLTVEMRFLTQGFLCFGVLSASSMWFITKTL